jgi:hypothetical protein
VLPEIMPEALGEQLQLELWYQQLVEVVEMEALLPFSSFQNEVVLEVLEAEEILIPLVVQEVAEHLLVQQVSSLP